MARSDARIPTSIWHDTEFCVLPPNAKLLYLMLLTRPDLSGGGTIPLLPGRWARYTGLSRAATERAADELGEDGWLVCDDGEQEAFISGFFAAEKIASQPRRVVTALDAISHLSSSRLAAYASEELAALVDKAVTPAPGGVRAAVLMRDGYQCKSCGWQPGDPVPKNASGRDVYRALEIDHVYPKSRGGADDAANYQVLCTSCNSSKGART